MKMPIMKMSIGVLAIAVAFAAPALARDGTKQQSKAAHSKTVKAKVVKRTAPRVLLRDPYAHHPSYDVYVNGEYAGSDPDPRIRWSLRREYCEQRVDGC